MMKNKTVAIVVAHPDDETLWAGGMILSHPFWSFFVICLSKANDKELTPRFYNALSALGVEGVMGDYVPMNEADELNDRNLEHEILELLPETHFDIIITHNKVDNTNNLLQNKVYEAIVNLRDKGKISTTEIWTFANEAEFSTSEVNKLGSIAVSKSLTRKIWNRKYNIITRIFGYSDKKLGVNVITSTESFWKIKIPGTKKHDSNELKIFKTPSIEALKFLYRKYATEKLHLDSSQTDNLLANDFYWKYRDINASKQFGTELNIFKTPSIDHLKSLYYKSLVYLFDRSSLRNETTHSQELFWQSKYYRSSKKIIKQFGADLSIFKTPSIDSLKLLYNKNLSYVFENNKLELDTLGSSDESTQTNTDQSVKNHSIDLIIFKALSIDNLKHLYNRNFHRN